MPPPWWAAFPHDSSRDAFIGAINKCLQPDGGFGNWPRSESYLECCFQAFVALNSLDATSHVDNSRVLSFLLEREVAAGGFSDEADGNPTLFNTFYAIVCLNMLGRLRDVNREAHVNFVRSHMVSGRRSLAFSCMPGWDPELIATLWGVIILSILGALAQEDRESLGHFIGQCWVESEGAYGASPGHPPYIEYTYCAVALQILLERPISEERSTRIVSFVERLFDGGSHLFGEIPSAPGTLGDSMWAASCLSMLSAVDALDLRTFRRTVRSVVPDQLWSLHCQLSILNYLDQAEPSIRLKVINVDHVPDSDGYALVATALHNRSVIAGPLRRLNTFKSTHDHVEGMLNELEHILVTERHRSVADIKFDAKLDAVSAEVSAAFLPGPVLQVEEGDYAFVELTSEPELLSIPIELSRLDNDILGIRLSCGRMIRSDIASIGVNLMPPDALHVLLLAGSHRGRKEVLPGSAREIAGIAKKLRIFDSVEVCVLAGRELNRDTLRTQLTGTQWDIVHFSGHTFASSSDGWISGILLADGELEARIMAEWTRAHRPRLVFINGCAAGRMKGRDVGMFRWANRGIGTAWMELGVAYIGSYWSIRDGDSSRFGERFYGYVMEGIPVGEALRLTRVHMRNGGIPQAAWAGYSLLGSPRLRLSRYRFSPR
ncbi:CHAT domain-containing protein [Nonomuraea sp. NPDC051941]|uniref:prenyltransferase/squalene oxidase repeat-containing protein n=1 Tax=Nonomuraea sp. NPDC051941 TaxID=3364373 RepID=UPI0037C83D21